ncbi:unnamed protein product [Heligmosomoides polygyrus]|uniref:Uncharacterized protein n=1 Tax=Heligmosomoides polygyrus TaxID=6339 RepID=A0A183F8E3_HELPZ|nr:unnamed protein product [Heligmosomoides polygyrus]
MEEARDARVTSRRRGTDVMVRMTGRNSAEPLGDSAPSMISASSQMEAGPLLSQQCGRQEEASKVRGHRTRRSTARIARKSTTPSKEMPPLLSSPLLNHEIINRSRFLDSSASCDFLGIGLYVVY